MARAFLFVCRLSGPKRSARLAAATGQPRMSALGHLSLLDWLSFARAKVRVRPLHLPAATACVRAIRVADAPFRIDRGATAYPVGLSRVPRGMGGHPFAFPFGIVGVGEPKNDVAHLFSPLTSSRPPLGSTARLELGLLQSRRRRPQENTRQLSPPRLLPRNRVQTPGVLTRSCFMNPP